MEYSIVVPAHNEEGSLEKLYQAVLSVFDKMESPTSPEASRGTLLAAKWEMIVVDDGSTDDTYEVLQTLHDRDSRVKVIRFRRQFGQTAGWSAGFDSARGKYVIVLDADLQNDPEDIPAMIQKLKNDNLDVVSGWRKDRKDGQSLMFLSKIGNRMRRWVTGEKIHDHGCSLKVYRSEALKNLELYGEMHRYITALLSWQGYNVGEMVVRHHPREHGKTKYSVRKKFKGILDLLIVKFWIQYSARPMHFFGAIGAVFIAAGFLLGGTLGALWLFRVIGLQNRSTPLLAVLLVLLGFQFLLSGVLADIVAHTYYAKKKPYSIKSTEGF